MTARKQQPVKVHSRVRVMRLEAEGPPGEMASIVGAAITQFFTEEEEPPVTGPPDPEVSR